MLIAVMLTRFLAGSVEGSVSNVNNVLVQDKRLNYEFWYAITILYNCALASLPAEIHIQAHISAIKVY